VTEILFMLARWVIPPDREIQRMLEGDGPLEAAIIGCATRTRFAPAPLSKISLSPAERVLHRRAGKVLGSETWVCPENGPVPS
jgi:hypothetical protein